MNALLRHWRMEMVGTMAALAVAAFVGLHAYAAEPTPSEENLVKNGKFTEGTDEKGWPKFWSCAGDKSVDQVLSLDNDPQRGPCARLTCKTITGGGPASHAMICQHNAV